MSHGTRSINYGRIASITLLTAFLGAAGFGIKSCTDAKAERAESNDSLLKAQFPEDAQLSVTDFSRIVMSDENFCLVTILETKGNDRITAGEQKTLEYARSDVGCYNDTLKFMNWNWHSSNGRTLRVITDFYASANEGEPYRSIECLMLKTHEDIVCKDIMEAQSDLNQQQAL